MPAMMRKCSHCEKEFTPQELSREDTKGMEAERKALGLEGVDVHPLEGESEEAFGRRRDELEATIKQMDGEGVEVVVSTRN